eukprot:TRINITY_DN5400_c0_g1_i1.p1 TRINITY_DN5400_c0_g1~~TRINITY_DN5400_c0_g1_i1.p1  ORF type:complete len:1269 (+),score=275.17 TRINITY_DN5400_c0_g1_i1:199-3807(+)
MKAYMDRGELIPNELTTQLLTEKLGAKEFQNGFIMDGYPRNLSHVPIFEQILSDLDYKTFAVFYFDVSKDRLMERLDGRIICGGCNEVYNTSLSSSDKCAKCGQTLCKRKDDTAEVLEKRLQVYEKETFPLVDHYEKQQLLIPINCLDKPEEVTNQLLSSLVTFEEKHLEQMMDSFTWFQSQMNNPMYIDNESERIKFLTRFRDKALKENLHNRSGIMRRFVFLRTSNKMKFKEHTNIFTGLYGIEVLRIPPNVPDTLIKGLLKIKTNDLVPLAVIREESNLYRPNSTEYCSLQHGVRAVNRSELRAHIINKEGNLQEKHYVYDTMGRIDLDRRVTFFNPEDVFGWDDIFVLLSNGLSYHQLQQNGIKRSSRDMVISDYLHEHIHYKYFLDVEFNKQTPHRVIDFSVSVNDFVEKNKYYNNPFAVKYGYRNLQNHVLNFGVFFRAAKNRRQNNYWNPGLNGGIPLTKKKDEIHELTFMAHDFGHFAIPDLIFVGTNSVNHRRAYIMWRMASEATTMALADMLFVDSLKQSGVEYDFNTRRIYPLFLDLGMDLTDTAQFVANLKRVIHANFHYCLTGNDEYYKKMIENNKKDLNNLNRFKEKFMPFFVEDFRWTERNYDNMLKRSDEMRRWWDAIKPIRDMKYLNLKSVDDFLGQIGSINDSDNESFLNQIFERVFEDQILPVLEEKVELLPESVRLQRAFTRYMAGQLAIFSKYYFIPESSTYQNDIIKHLVDNEKGMSVETINKIRKIYEDYLHILVQKNLISKDDEATFSELYPLFDPYYVSYDQDLSSYEDLTSISKRILSLKAHREKQFNQIEQVMGRLLEDSEKRFVSHISLMVEEADGLIQDGFFVIKPGVMMVAQTNWKDNSTHLRENDQVTFLLAGISIETSLEFVAHKEARVARLTSSKTNSMNVPLFRVQGIDTWAQRKYLCEVIKQRVKFENSYQPRKKWDNGSELFNITSPGCKSTAMLYTMSVKDFHKLFIGRMGPDGNENEVREVVRKMASDLHQAYPDHILSPDDYLSLTNNQKYKATKTAQKNDDAQTTSQFELNAETQITSQARNLMRKLNICIDQPHYVSLSSFCSRITYLAFLKEMETGEQSMKYLQKMTSQLGHYSVVAAVQVVFTINVDNISDQITRILLPYSIHTLSNTRTIAISLKDLHQLFFQWNAQAKTEADSSILNELVSHFSKAYPNVISTSYNQ